MASRLFAITLVALAVAFVMSPAAYHRHTGPREVTESFVRVSTRLLLLGMWPLAIGICLDFYLVSRVILNAGAARGLPPAFWLHLLDYGSCCPRTRRHRAKMLSE